MYPHTLSPFLFLFLSLSRVEGILQSKYYYRIQKCNKFFFPTAFGQFLSGAGWYACGTVEVTQAAEITVLSLFVQVTVQMPAVWSRCTKMDSDPEVDIVRTACWL